MTRQLSWPYSGCELATLQPKIDESAGRAPVSLGLVKNCDACPLTEGRWAAVGATGMLMNGIVPRPVGFAGG
jgi:hypothetical protein